MFRHIVLASVSVVALTAAANAADMYAPGGGYKDEFVPVAAWTGFYAGVNGGYGWSAESSTLSGSGSETAACPTSTATACPIAVTGAGTNTFGSDGEFAGGQIGYNLQPAGSHYVLGVEADIQGSGIQGSGAISSLLLTPAVANVYGTSELDWFGSVRGRIGYAFDRSLIYATGGAAFGGVKDSLTVTPAVGSAVNWHSSATETGYVVGGGFEHYILPAWSIKAEYQYIDLGSDKSPLVAAGTGTPPGTCVAATHGSAAQGCASATLNADHAYETVRIGLNYHIFSDYVPLK